jgi:hypothetical protein
VRDNIRTETLNRKGRKGHARALRDAVETGPTGNNLRDLRILLAY